MQNVTMNIDPVTLQRIVERHINESLAADSHARITVMGSACTPNPQPNQPTVTLTVTFDAVKKPGK